LLAQQRNHVSYRAIYDVIKSPGFIAGDGTNGYKANVRSLVKRIRKKFTKVDAEFDLIKNYTGFGYVLERRALRLT
jgi:two-component system response regulator ChvI